ncbi:MAG: AMP-dependent synthetase/ligase [Terriglobia bacterium]
MAGSDFETLNELFLTASARHAKPDAFLSKREGRYQGRSSADAVRRVAALALALDGLGASRGASVALLSENREEWALADYALLGLGVVGVPIYPTLPAREIEFILRDSESLGIILSTADQAAKVAAIRDRLPRLQFILAMDAAAADGVLSFEQVIASQLARDTAPEADFRARALQSKPADTATIIYTSGSMGQAKGVILTHANVVANIKACMALFPFRPEDRLVSFLPLAHILERMIEYFAFWMGASIAYAESIDALPHNLLEIRPQILAVVPRVLEKVHARVMETVEQGPPARRRLFNWALRVGRQYSSAELEKRPVSLRLGLEHAVSDKLVGAKIRARFGGRLKYLICGSAPLRRQLVEFFYSMGLPVYEGYGLTETSPVISVNYPGAVKLGTVGLVLDNLDVKLGEASVDAEGRTGREILVRGPSIFPGYYKLERENQAAFNDGWFHTGDLGTVDPDGYLTITGRKKNLMKTSGGKYVAPEKIESLFHGHSDVAQMVVLGDGRHFVAALIVPHFDRLEAFARERGIAFQSRDDLVLNPEVRRWIQAHVDAVCQPLANYEQIHQIALLPREFTIEAGELSPTLKIRRYVVEERYRDVIDEIYRRPAPEVRAARL